MPPAFTYVGGDPALDLVNTVDWTAAGPAGERLVDYRALVDWAQGAGAISPATGERLRRAARAHPRRARETLARAIRLRALLRDAFGGPGPAQAEAVRALNPLLAHALERLRLGALRGGSRRQQWTWAAMDERLDSPLWPVLRAAALLLTSAEAERVRTCAGPDCGWMYVDRSRNGFRRWCQMRTCGTREKSRRRRVTAAG
ncbi:MAG TPA: ABATE domain-containing protein [Gemmatimonadales bacterium]|nr:ABATE domain-containing protein [Gemmatimonadales bacterium]